jgi:outer membrane protein assembly factor BamB
VYVVASNEVDYQIPNPTLFFDPGADQALSGLFDGLTFGEPTIDSVGNLRIVTYKLVSSILTKLSSLSATGQFLWTTPSASDQFVTSVFAFRHMLTLGPDDRAYMYEGNRMFAFDVTGAPMSGWPQDLFPANSHGASRFANKTPVLVDSDDGTVYAKVGVYNSFQGFPDTVFAMRPDGSLKWRRDYSNGGPNFGLVQGPIGHVFTITNSATGALDQLLVGIDHSTGAETCRQTTTSYFDNLVGGPEGLFTSFGRELKAYDANCQSAVIFTTERDQLVLHDYVQQTIIGVDYQLSHGATDTDSDRLVGVFRDGTFLWRNSRILPDRLSSASSVVRAVRGLIVYVFGRDLQDVNRRKLFLVHSRTGEVVGSVDTDPVCVSCDLAVGTDGTMYFTDLFSNKIFKLLPAVN